MASLIARPRRLGRGVRRSPDSPKGVSPESLEYLQPDVVMEDATSSFEASLDEILQVRKVGRKTGASPKPEPLASELSTPASRDRDVNSNNVSIPQSPSQTPPPPRRDTGWPQTGAGAETQAEMAGFGQAPAFGAQALSTDAINRSVSPFGAPFNSSSTFGQPQQTQQTSVFGAPAPATSNAFPQSQQPPSFGFPNNATNPSAGFHSGGGGFGGPGMASNGHTNSNPFAPATTASNPFATQTSAGNASNPFSNAVPAAASGFGTASNPFAAATSTNGFGAPSNSTNGPSNFFAKPAESPDYATAPFAGTTANNQKRKNGFGDTGALKRLAFDSTTNSFANPQTASASGPASNSSVGFGMKDTRKNGNGFADYLKERETSGLGPKTARAQSLDLSRAKKSAAVYEKEIRDQLRKDNIHPPGWPRQPGNPANRQAMDDHSDKYKKYQGRVRTSLIKAGLIDDPEVRKKLSDAIDFKGICQDMCPEGEKVSRIVEFDVKMAEKTTSPDGLEMWPDPDRMIKSFKRSAAGTDSPLPTEVRSPAALRRTVDYLIDDFLKSDENLPSQHNFLWDRTRAIRKDFIFQNAMSAEERTDQIYCLENIARFHAVALHLLSQENFAAEDFSEQQEREQLGKTLLSLMQVYDECKDMEGMNMENEAEFRAYYLLFNAHDPFVMQQMQDWNDKFWFNSNDIQTAVTLIEAMQNVWNGRGPLKPQVALTTGSASFTTYFSIVEDRKVSYTMACFAEIHFTQIRRQLVKSIHRAYGRVRDGPKDLTAKVLNNILRFDNEQQCIAFLEELEMEFSSEGADEPYLVVERRRSIPGKTIRQSFSGIMVERKRGDRPLPEVIHTTVFEEASATIEDFHSVDSMFVTQSSGSLGLSASGDLRASHADVNFSDDDTPSSSPQPPLKTLSPFQRPPTTNGFSTSDTNKSVLGSATPNPFSQASSNPFFQAPSTTSGSSADGSASNAKPPSFPWASKPSTNSVLSDPSSSEPVADPPTQMPKFSWSTTPADTAAKSAPTDGSSGSVFDFLNKPAEAAKSSFIPGTATSPSTVSSNISSSLVPSESQATQVKEQASGLELFPPTKTAGAPPASVSDHNAVPSGNSPSVASSSPLFTQQPSEVPQPKPTPLFTQASEMAKPNTSPATPPPPPQPPTPPKDLMGDFAKWVVLGDNGLMDEFQEALVTHLVRAVYDQHQVEEEERKRREEDDRSWAQARKFRKYSLRVRFFYRWRDNARKSALKRVGRHNRAAMKRYREAKIADAKAAKTKAEKEEQSRIKRLTGPSSWLDEMEKDRASKRARRESMSLDTSRRGSITSSNADALLATGIFSGMENQRELAANCVRDDDSLYDALVGVTIHPNPSQQSMGPPARPKDPLRSVRNAAVAKTAPKPKLSKKAQYLQDLMSGKHKEDDLISFKSSNSSRLARSVPTGGKATNFSRYQSSSPRSSAEPERPRNGPGSGIKSSYWLLRSRGLFATPTGHVLSDKAPRPVMNHTHEGGSQYSGDSDAGDLDDRVLDQDGAYRASLGLTGSRRSTFSVPQSAAGSPPRHSFLKPKPGSARQSLPAGISSTSLLASRQTDGDAVSQTGSAVSTLQQDVEESLRELKRVAAELDSETDWYREQNKQLSQGQQAFGA